MFNIIENRLEERETAQSGETQVNGGPLMTLYQNIQNEPIEKLNLRGPITVASETPVREVVAQMQLNELGCAVVVDEERQPIGLFTEGRLTEMLTGSLAALDNPVGLHASRRFPMLAVKSRIIDLLNEMEAANSRFVVIQSDDGLVMGIAGQKSLMEYIAEHFPSQVMVQRVGQKPYTHNREGA